MSSDDNIENTTAEFVKMLSKQHRKEAVGRGMIGLPIGISASGSSRDALAMTTKGNEKLKSIERSILDLSERNTMYFSTIQQEIKFRDDQLADVKKQLENEKAKRRQLKEEYKTCISENAQLKQKVDAQQIMIQHLRTNVATLEENISTLQRQNADALSSLRKENAEYIASLRIDLRQDLLGELESRLRGMLPA